MFWSKEIHFLCQIAAKSIIYHEQSFNNRFSFSNVSRTVFSAKSCVCTKYFDKKVLFHCFVLFIRCWHSTDICINFADVVVCRFAQPSGSYALLQTTFLRTVTHCIHAQCISNNSKHPWGRLATPNMHSAKMPTYLSALILLIFQLQECKQTSSDLLLQSLYRCAPRQHRRTSALHLDATTLMTTAQMMTSLITMMCLTQIFYQENLMRIVLPVAPQMMKL